MSDINVATICNDLAQLQKQLVFCTNLQNKVNNSVESFLRIQIGYSTKLPEPERKRIVAVAHRYRIAVEKTLQEEDGDPCEVPRPEGMPRRAALIVRTNVMSRREWDGLRKEIEATMTALAMQLPVYTSFVKQVKGVGALGLAAIVGEAGTDLSNFPTRSHLQKRLSIACIDGRRQGNPGPNATAEDWIRHGHKPKRRAQVWAFLDDTMLRHQWRGPVTDDAGHEIEPGQALGKYGQYYAGKKAEYIVRNALPADDPRHIKAPDKAARRYMAKMFIRDLYNAWRNTEVVEVSQPIRRRAVL